MYIRGPEPDRRYQVWSVIGNPKRPTTAAQIYEALQHFTTQWEVKQKIRRHHWFSIIKRANMGPAGPAFIIAVLRAMLQSSAVHVPNRPSTWPLPCCSPKKFTGIFKPVARLQEQVGHMFIASKVWAAVDQRCHFLVPWNWTSDEAGGQPLKAARMLEATVECVQSTWAECSSNLPQGPENLPTMLQVSLRALLLGERWRIARSLRTRSGSSMVEMCSASGCQPFLKKNHP